MPGPSHSFERARKVPWLEPFETDLQKDGEIAPLASDDWGVVATVHSYRYIVAKTTVIL
jgi:hypothetical protein